PAIGGSVLANFTLGQPMQVLIDLDALLACNAEAADWHAKRAVARLWLTRWDEVAADLDEALCLDPAQSLAYDIRYWVSGAVRDYCESYFDNPLSRFAIQRFSTAALAACNEALRHTPDAALRYCNRGWIHWIRNEWKEAQTDFEKAAELDPGNPTAYDGLA